MALSADISQPPEFQDPSPEIATLTDFSNDAFSFWKLPQELYASLAPSTRESELVIRRYLFEEYLSEGDRRPSRTLTAYYMVKRLIPIAIRHRINAIAIRARRRRDFPHWPCETALLDFWRDWLRVSMNSLGIDDAWHIGFWPDGHRCCIVLTHDVESPFGLDRIRRMTDLEEKYGFRSALNFPLAQYPIDWSRFEDLKQRGFEFGAHGLRHDGKLFRSEADFMALAPILEQSAREQGFSGFRSPSTLRRVEWLTRLSFDFDCSFSDTDPYEPQPGGSCSVFPFFLGGMVELPYTVPQDHTLIHLLGRDPLPIWIAKAHWIAAMGGMILTLTHPDYSGDPPHLSAYEELLKRLNDIADAWKALPSEVAHWWRQRARLRLRTDDGVPRIVGAGSERAAARLLSEEALAG
jgi:peptidoglycan/xylan/chitin deacetylase (PgdA/CDA1 family)